MYKTKKNAAEALYFVSVFGKTRSIRRKNYVVWKNSAIQERLSQPKKNSTAVPYKYIIYWKNASSFGATMTHP